LQLAVLLTANEHSAWYMNVVHECLNIYNFCDCQYYQYHIQGAPIKTIPLMFRNNFSKCGPILR